MAAYRGRSTSTLGVAVVRIASTWLLPTIIAVAICPFLAVAAPPNPSGHFVILEIGADSVCRVDATPVDCGKVGFYMRDTLRLPDTIAIHFAIAPTVRYETTATLIRSLQITGFHNLGFVADSAE
jgi:hypothetical protein